MCFACKIREKIHLRTLISGKRSIRVIDHIIYVDRATRLRVRGRIGKLFSLFLI